MIMTIGVRRVGAARVALSLMALILAQATPSAEPEKGGENPEHKRFTLDDLKSEVHLSAPQISPDGKSIALLVTRAQAETNRWKTELELVDVQTGSHRSLTPERDEVYHARWSPSGDRIAFLSRRAS